MPASTQSNARKILVSSAEGNEKWKSALQSRLPDADIISSDDEFDPEEIRYGVLWKQPQGLLGKLKNLEAIFSLGAGVDHILASPALPQDLPVIRLKDAGMAEQMVQYHLYAALHFMRDFDIYQKQQQTSDWLQHDVARINTCHIGVMGLGALGATVATALANLGFTVSGWARSIKTIDGVTSFAGTETFEEFLSQSDILICLLPKTPDTEGILNAKSLSCLPKNAAIINAARGAAIVEEDLLRLLDTGHLRGAFLDVAQNEPLPAGHPFWDHPKIRLTPHIAASTRIDEAVEQIAENIARLEKAQAPDGLVDRKTGY